MTVPNILTLTRIPIALFVFAVLLIFVNGFGYWLALIGFMFATSTDFLDGWIARRHHQTSDIGRMLDPIADKLLIILTVSALLARQALEGGIDPIIAFCVMIILTREVLVAGLREFVGQSKGLTVSRLAKWKTGFQMFAICLLLVAGAVSGDLVYQIARVMLLVATALTLVTGCDYTIKAIRLLKDKNHGS